MKEFLEIFNVVAPSIVAIMVVYITYRYGIKQKKLEAKEDYYKRLRISISNLLLIWKELHAVQKFLKDADPSNEFIVFVPEIAKKYLKIDSEKIKQLQESYHNSLNELKDIDVLLYYKLVNLLNPFNVAVDEILVPILNDSYFTKAKKDKIIIPLIDSTISGLENEIQSILVYLPKNEAKQINKLISEHNSSLTEYAPSQIPDFILNFINSRLKTKEPITGDEMRIFYSNPTVLWGLKKIFKSNKNFLSELSKPVMFFKLISALGRNKTPHILTNILGKYNDNEILRNITITEEEEKLHFIGNKTIFRLILGLALKLKGEIPFSVKRVATQLYRGDISICKELENYKLQLEAQAAI